MVHRALRANSSGTIFYASAPILADPVPISFGSIIVYVQKDLTFGRQPVVSARDRRSTASHHGFNLAGSFWLALSATKRPEDGFFRLKNSANHYLLDPRNPGRTPPHKLLTLQTDKITIALTGHNPFRCRLCAHYGKFQSGLSARIAGLSGPVQDPVPWTRQFMIVEKSPARVAGQSTAYLRKHGTPPALHSARG